jgi:hypothetical protein
MRGSASSTSGAMIADISENFDLALKTADSSSRIKLYVKRLDGKLASRRINEFLPGINESRSA